MMLLLRYANWPKVRKKYLVLSKPTTYYPHKWDPNHYGVFDKVFTHTQRLVDYQKYWPDKFGSEANTWCIGQLILKDLKLL